MCVVCMVLYSFVRSGRTGVDFLSTGSLFQFMRCLHIAHKLANSKTSSHIQAKIRVSGREGRRRARTLR